MWMWEPKEKKSKELSKPGEYKIADVLSYSFWEHQENLKKPTVEEFFLKI